MKKHYVCVVGYETDTLDKEGNPKIKRARYLVEALSFHEGVNTMVEYLKTDPRGNDIISFSESKFEDVLTEHQQKVLQIS